MNNESDLHKVVEEVKQGKLVSAILSSPWKKGEEEPVRITIRPIQVKGQHLFQASFFYPKKVKHHNLIGEDCANLFVEKMKNEFRQGVVETNAASYHLLVNKKNFLRVIKKKRAIEKVPSLLHNQPKKHILQEGIPIPFLVALGIMQSNGKVIAKKYDKFRQINRFVEMVRDIVDNLPKGKTLEIVDFGCGKAYLTFALYHFLTCVAHREVNIKGLDLKEEVIKKCQSLADELNYTHLKFIVGDINDYQSSGKVDLVISLHACDTASDAALEKAVLWDADVILCVPCCQHELYSQVQNENLNSLLRHGILRERFAALVTDAARADLLTLAGYDVQILEFIDMEHTPKNLLIRAVKSHKGKSKHVKDRYMAFKQTLHIYPSLEKRMENRIDT
jgi:SAM-dependent methyltransferase